MAGAIEVSTVSKTFSVGSNALWWRRSQGEVHALSDVSLSVHPGEVYGLVGRNGYGKTTLIKCICSLVEPTLGAICVFGVDTRQDRLSVRRSIGYVGSEERSFYWRLTGRQNLSFFGRLHGLDAHQLRRSIESLSETFGVRGLLDRRFQEYSTGNRQRLSIVRALLHNPRILILDEPTRSIDPFAADALRKTLLNWVVDNASRCVFITSHNLAEVELLSHRLGIMSRGRLTQQGTLDELRKRFDDREIVRLFVDARTPLDRTMFESAGLATVAVDDAPNGGVRLEFRHRKNDDAIHTAIRVAVQSGATIRSVECAEMSLQDIIERVDNGQDVA